LVIPVWQGYAAARGYLPLIDGAWYATLTNLRDKSPPESIVNTWWDYGYWTKYLANRRVSADGGSLATHITYWTARALAAQSERESAGLLRMIDCGSDATPQPEGREGAYGKLRSYHVDGPKAVVILGNLARMARTEARTYLASEKLDPAAQDDILRSTHCDPPPAYLMLSSQMSPVGGWWYLGSWDFGRGYMLREGRKLSESAAAAEMVVNFGYAAQAARSLHAQARAVKSNSEEMSFAAPSSASVDPRWIACDDEGAKLVCDANLKIGRDTFVEKVTYAPDDPAGSRLLVARSGDARQIEIAPAAVIVAQPTGVKDLSIPAAPDAALALLVDVANKRVIVASPGLLRSTYSRLAYLGGGTGKFFTKVHEQTGFWDEQVTLWKIDWQRLREEDEPPR